MKTKKIYQQDVYIREWDSVITSVISADTETDVKENTREYIITLDATPFFPEGGGQSCDTGSIDGWKVTKVYRDGDDIFHRIRVEENFTSPKVDMRVHCSINWERRFDNMQRHCGEHILSGVIFKLFGGINRGFHMGEDYMTIDIDTVTGHDGLSQDAFMEAELEANKIIWSDAPIFTRYFSEKEEASGMPLRKTLTLDEDISIVSIGMADDIADCVACCGTHPSSAGQVGLLKIFKVEKNKGMYRIYFEAGKRAFEKYRTYHVILTDLSRKYSSTPENLPEKIEAKEINFEKVTDELHQLKKTVIDRERSILNKILENHNENTLFYSMENINAEDAVKVGKPYIDDLDSVLLVLFAEKENSCILVSSGFHDCDELVRENAFLFDGKGGGNRNIARVSFPSIKQVDLFYKRIADALN